MLSAFGMIVAPGERHLSHALPGLVQALGIAPIEQACSNCNRMPKPACKPTMPAIVWNGSPAWTYATRVSAIT
ncbi:MAG: hypothetical protein R3F38_13285 [Gammaproteobacteria bacterium]